MRMRGTPNMSTESTPGQSCFLQMTGPVGGLLKTKQINE